MPWQRWPNLSGRVTRIRATASRRFSTAGAALTRTLVFGEPGATWDDPTVTWDDPAWSWDGQPVGGTADLTVTADPGVWTPGDVEWAGSVGILLVGAFGGEWTATAPFTPVVTPPCHVTVIPREDRTTVIPAESRLTAIPTEDRRTVIPADDRTTVVPAEDRTTRIGACP